MNFSRSFRSRAIFRGRIFCSLASAPLCCWSVCSGPLDDRNFTVAQFSVRSSLLSASCVRVLCLRNLLCASTSPALRTSAAGRRKSAGVFIARPKWQVSSIDGSAFSQWRGPDFLSRTLVTALQLRVAEFPEAYLGFQRAQRSCSGHQRRFGGNKSRVLSEDGLRFSAPFRCR